MKFPDMVTKEVYDVITLKRKVKETAIQYHVIQSQQLWWGCWLEITEFGNNVSTCSSQLHLYCCVTYLDWLSVNDNYMNKKAAEVIFHFSERQKKKKRRGLLNVLSLKPCLPKWLLDLPVLLFQSCNCHLTHVCYMH